MPSDVGDEGLLDVHDPNPPDFRSLPAYQVAEELARARGATTVRIAGRHVVGPLDLSGSSTPRRLEFVNCRFGEPLVLEHASIREIRVESCWLPGLAGRHLDVAGDLVVVDTTVRGPVDLAAARVGGSLLLTGGRLDHVGEIALTADWLDVAGDVVVTGVEVIGGVRMRNLRAAGDVRLLDSTVFRRADTALDGSGMQVGGNLVGVGLRIAGLLNVSGARVDRDLDFSRSRLTDTAADTQFRADNLITGGDANLSYITGAGLLRMRTARIRGSLNLSGTWLTFAQRDASNWILDLDGSEIGRDLNADGLVVTDGVRLRDVSVGADAHFLGADLAVGPSGIDADRLRTGGDVRCWRVRVNGGVQMRAARIGGDLDLREADLQSATGFDLEAARIDRDLICDRSVIVGSFRMRRAEIGRSARFSGTVLREGSILDATGARAQDFVLTPRESWGLVIMNHARCVMFFESRELWSMHHGIDIADFRYAALGDPDAEHWDAGQVLAYQSPDLPRTQRILFSVSLRPYQPSIYFQLAATLTSVGNHREARTVLINRQFQRYKAMRANALQRWLSVFWSFLQYRSTGYGYRAGSVTLTGLMVLIAGGVGAYYALGSPPLQWLLALVALIIIAYLATVATGIAHRVADRRSLADYAGPTKAIEPPESQPGLPVAELRSVVAEEVGGAVRTALTGPELARQIGGAVRTVLMGPELVNFAGLFAVEVLSIPARSHRGTRGPLVLTGAQDVPLEVSLRTNRGTYEHDRPEIIAKESVYIDGGRRADQAEFDLVIDSATLDVTPRRTQLVVNTQGSDSDRQRLRVSVPDDPGTHETWLQLYQAGQLVQALTVVIQVGAADD